MIETINEKDNEIKELNNNLEKKLQLEISLKNKIHELNKKC